MTAPASNVTILDLSAIQFCMVDLLKDLLLLQELTIDQINAKAVEIIEDVITEQVYIRSKWTEPREYQTALAREIMYREDLDEVNEILNQIHEVLVVFLDQQRNSDWAVYRCVVSTPRPIDSGREMFDDVDYMPTNLYIHEVGDYRIMQWEKANVNLLAPNGSLKKRVS